MIFFQAIVYGLVQGVAEFLPISSTAHLILIPYFFHWQDPGLSFDIFLHLGTVVAIVIFFFWDWVKIFKDGFSRKSNLLWWLVIASIPAGVFGYLFESKAETTLRAPLLIATTLFVFGLMLLLVDKLIKHQKKIKNLGFGKSFLIGLTQAIAIIPGVSRSGATMTGGMLVGLKRKSAAKFSFLLATPAMIGAFILDFKKIFEPTNSGIFSGLGFLPGIVAFIMALVSGYLAIKYLLRYLGKGSFVPFVVYRILLAAAIVIFYLLTK
jgi:undecaprenyl-diphosphatase